MTKNWYRIEAKSNSEADVFIYDEIGYFGISADSFVKELSALKVDRINLRLNTPGGSVFDGFAIYNALVMHKAEVVTHIDGLAASIGSVIALAGDEVNIAQNAFFMIHNPHAIVMGESRDMRQMAEVLDKLAGSILKTYTDRNGKSAEEMQALMDAETWLTADEAKEAGFVDNVTNRRTEKAQFDLSAYARAPKELLDEANHNMPTERELEAALREAGGLSRAAAKAVVKKGYQALTQRDAEDGPQREAAKDSYKTNQKENKDMDQQTLKDQHPDIYKAVIEEGRASGAEDALAKGRLEGAKAEQERIQSVKEQMMPGHEALIESLMFDGKTTGEQAAVAVLQAERNLRAARHEDYKKDGSASISHGEGGGDTAMKRKDFNALPPSWQANYIREGGKVID